MKFLPPIIFTVLAFGSMVYYFFIRPQVMSKKMSIAGEVIFIEKRKRSGSLDIEIQESLGRRWIVYSFQDIQVGDSLFKQADSGLLFVKSKKDGTLRLTRDRNVLISEIMTYQ